MYFFLIGPAGSGKTTIGKKFNRLKFFKHIEGDEFHTKKNIKKMMSGKSLNFKDRKPWLNRINSFLRSKKKFNVNYVISCSALRKTYRKLLSKKLDDCHFFYLKCDKKTLFLRNLKRNHFFPISLLDNQIKSFENSNDLFIIKSSFNINKVYFNSKKKIFYLLKKTL
tara:strand:+ start:896 stop:1396 length:501 start_codon:yes stop_codon:yes gene_type:complete